MDVAEAILYALVEVVKVSIRCCELGGGGGICPHPAVFVTLRVAMIWDTTGPTRLEGMAKPTPSAGVLNSGSTEPSVGIPIRLPCKSTNAPPLLPGVIGASV